MNYSDAIEKLTIYFSGPQYQSEVLQAKRSFFGDVGVDDKESSRYEQWMNIFYDWYLFSRPVSGTQLPPARYALEIEEFQQLHQDEKGLFSNLGAGEHALLQFIKVKKDLVYFKDLFRGRKVKVVKAEFALTLEKGDICDCRIIPDGEIFHMSKGFFCHPAKVNRFILKEVKALKKAEPLEQEALMLELTRMFFKMEQYSHLRFDQIYSRESKVRF